MFRQLLCNLGFHKYEAIEATITWVDKYTEGADLMCNHCGHLAYGERPI